MPCDDCSRAKECPPCVNEELPPPEGPEYTSCVLCGHIEPEHAEELGGCLEDDCDCSAYRTQRDFELPPQPDRRPPYAVAYSVDGHGYEALLPGDASVIAEDGVLKISHPGLVAGIVYVKPVGTEEGDG